MLPPTALQMLRLLLALLLVSSAASAQTIVSPSGTLSLTFELLADGSPRYRLSRGATAVVRPSRLGLRLKELPAFVDGFRIVRVDSASVDRSWAPVWGESRQIRDRHKELAITLQQPQVADRSLVIRFRLFDDGVGFRYEFPASMGLKHFIVTDELTEFALTGDHKAFWIPGDYDTNEYAYNTTTLSGVNGAIGGAANEIHARSPIGADFVQTPLMLKSADGLYVNVHEAALVNYPAMNLKVNKSTFTLSSQLVPDATGNKAYLRTPSRTPWRTVVVSDKATDVLASRIILNLNEPTTLTNTAWIKPTKYVGVWWEMHVGRSTWDYAGTQDMNSWENLANTSRRESMVRPPPA
jgi:glucan 1,4-alpha-glucosidase